MKYLNKLFSSNRGRSSLVRIDKGMLHYIDRSDVFNSATLLSIVKYINSVRAKHSSKRIPISFEFSNVNLKIQDKLAFVVFECICYSLKEEGRQVYVYWNPVNQILTQGVNYSPLLLLNTTNQKTNDRFKKSFNNDIYQRHFRRLITEKDVESNYLGVLLQDISTFLGVFNLSEKRIDKISTVIVELVGNAGEHGESECLIDIDITDDHTKKLYNVEQEGQYYGINIAIVSFSNHLLGEAVSQKVLTNNFDNGRYYDLKMAYQNHLKKIEDLDDNLYNEEYFWDIASLQDRISGRKGTSSADGTGLTVLINSLQKEADNDTCYVISGEKIISFKKDFIERDSNGWLGFNRQNDFFNHKPDISILDSSSLWIPGTAFNLNFVMRKEK